MTINEGLLREILRKVNYLELIAGGKGTVKLNGTGNYTSPLHAVCFSMDTTVTAMGDTDGNTIIDYFPAAVNTVKAGDILVPINAHLGNRFNSVTFSAGSAVGII